MADRKISDLTALTTPASGDFLPIVDISEAAAASKNKRITIEELMRGMPDGTAAAPGIAFETDPNTGIFSPGADQLAISTNGTGRLFINSTGLVGIGTSAPQAALHTNGAILASGALAATSASNIFFDQPTSVLSRIGVVGANTSTAGTLRISQYSSNGSVGRDVVSIDNAGNVGIGTTSPGYKLDISPDSAGAALRIRGGTGGVGIVQFTDNGISAQWGTIEAKSADINLTHSSVVRFSTASSESARIDSSRRLLVGTSSNLRSSKLQVLSTGNDHQSLVGGNQIAQFELCRSSNAAGGAGLVADTNILGRIQYMGNDGSSYISAARIEGIVDGTPGAGDMPGRLEFSVTADGAASPTEALRITQDRVIAYNRAAPATVNTTATLTAANLKTGIITSTTAAAVTMTLPTGTDIEAGFSGIYTNFTFEFSVINTGPSALTVGANGNTTVGSLTVATLTSARYALRRTGANTWTLYRLS